MKLAGTKKVSETRICLEGILVSCVHLVWYIRLAKCEIVLKDNLHF